ncbi:hypothetical protein [Shigella phage ESh4]|nr:hypothetical protein [Shigella phage ESh4]
MVNIFGVYIRAALVPNGWRGCHATTAICRFLP